MKIKCIAMKRQDLSEKVLNASGYTHSSFNELKIGAEHIVYGMRLNRDVLYYLIIYQSGSMPS